MRVAKLGVAVVLVVFALSVQPAHARGPSTKQERTKIIALIRSLESDPLNANANATRTSLVAWATELPEIQFHRCGDLLALDRYPYAREINDQVFLSGVAFTLERQDEMRNPGAAYLAGVEGALRMYEALRRSRPDAQSAVLDDLLRKRDSGQLASHIDQLAGQQCPTSKRILIAFPAAIAVDLILGALIGWLFARDRRRQQTSAALQWVVFGCAAYYAAAVAALHVLEPDWDPRYRFVSEYQWSDHGTLATTTFFVFALAVLTVALMLRSARLGFGVLVMAAIGICIAGIFRGFPLHDIGSALGLPGLVLATFLVSWRFRMWPGLVIGLMMLVALVTFFADIGMPGVQQRIFIALCWVWLVIVARQCPTRNVAK